MKCRRLHSTFTLDMRNQNLEYDNTSHIIKIYNPIKKSDFAFHFKFFFCENGTGIYFVFIGVFLKQLIPVPTVIHTNAKLAR